MSKRTVEVLVAECPACDEVVELVERLACASCDVSVRDKSDLAVAEAALVLGVRSVSAVAVDGALLDCCKGGVEESALERAGVGRP